MVEVVSDKMYNLPSSICSISVACTRTRCRTMLTNRKPKPCIVFTIAIALAALFFIKNRVVVKYEPRNLESTTRTQTTGTPQDEKEKQFIIQMERRMNERRIRIKNNCKQLGLLGKPFAEIQVITSKKYKLAYCPVAKTGCSNIKRIMLALNGYGKDPKKIFPQNILGENQHVHDETRKFSEVSSGMPQTVKENRYVTFMVVRHPYERVLSAYKNKIDIQPDGRLPQYFKTSHDIRVKYGPATTGTNATATFGQFVDYLYDANNEVFDGFSNHWNSANVLCQPCQNDYDVIIKVETMQDDIRYLMKLINATHIQLPYGYSKQGGKRINLRSTIDVMKNVTKWKQNRLHHVYLADFLLFGYDANLTENTA